MDWKLSCPNEDLKNYILQWLKSVPSFQVKISDVDNGNGLVSNGKYVTLVCRNGRGKISMYFAVT